jgi:hypothetical protein
MVSTVNELIVESYYASGIVSREFETVSGSQIAGGLKFLNAIIGDKAIQTKLLPYADKYTFNAQAGVEEYFIPNLVGIDTFVFYIQGLRYETNNQQRKQYFGSFRPTNIQSLPFNWHAERTLNGTNLFLFFIPDQNYPLEIWGNFKISSVTQFQDLSLTMEQFYINLLHYELTARLCKENNYIIPQDIKDQLQSYYDAISGQSNTIDLRMQKWSAFRKGGAINYAYVNVSGGWTPGGGD